MPIPPHACTPESVEAAKVATYQERLANGLDPDTGLPPADVPVAAPPHLLALRGTLPADTCCCGEPTYLHYDTSGIGWIGCVGVAARKRIAAMTMRPLRDLPLTWDAHPTVSQALRDCLRTACGGTMTTFVDTLSPEEILGISRRLAEIAVIAHASDEARK